MKNKKVLISIALFSLLIVLMTAEGNKIKQVVVERIQEIKNPKSVFRVELELNKKDAVYREGDEIKLTFKSTKDCYLTLIDVGTDGKVTIFFPNKFHKENRIKAGMIYSVPEKNAKWLLRVKGPIGKEVIKAIATLDKKDIIKQEDLKLEEEEAPFQVVDEENVENVTKSINVELKPVDAKRWAEAEKVIRVLKKEEKK